MTTEISEEMMEAARHAVEALEAEGFTIMAGSDGTTMSIGEPDIPPAVDGEVYDVRMRFHERRMAEPAFRAAVKAFLVAERPWRGW